MAQLPRQIILDRLVEKGLISEEQLRRAQEESNLSGESIKNILVKNKFITEDEFLSCLAEELGIPHLDLSSYMLDPAVLELISPILAFRHQTVPLFKIGETLSVAIADPTNVFALDEIRAYTHCEIEPVLCREADIKSAIEKYYSAAQSMDEVISTIKEEDFSPAALTFGAAEAVEEAPVIKLVNLMIASAVKDGASDIHIEPAEDTLRVRIRVDGVLHEVPSPPKHLQSSIISRIKVMGKMDIAESRLPQDGRFNLKIERREIDLRVSTFPTVYGENVVLRLLDTSSVLLGLEQLGFTSQNLEVYRKLTRRPYGIILVTGPTGSGKTTTLYASLNTINSPGLNIITVEDPIEYRLNLIRQSQINLKAGLTFATGLRSILRQDPDVIMVGEIRDLETAQISVQAALTGHLVFSTLHTNDAASAITRLVDMGIEPFLIASSVIACLAQRLVRIICSNCKQEDKIDLSRFLAQGLNVSVFEEKKIYKGRGCNNCRRTGFKGRSGIFELMVINEQIRDLIMAKAPSTSIKKAAQNAGMKVLREDGLEKVCLGLTTIEEVMRVTELD